MKPFRGEDNKLMKNSDALSNRVCKTYSFRGLGKQGEQGLKIRNGSMYFGQKI
jgi:hypothetical protein